MRLTRQTNYAIRILMYCAANPRQLSRISDIAQAYSVSELFLFKILQPLAQHGFLQTIRGRKGGIQLARPAEHINLAEIVKITEDNFAMADCFDGKKADCPLVEACALNATLHKALHAFFNVLENTTLADLTDKKLKVGERLGIQPTSAEKIAPALKPLYHTS